jgi:uncharacterized membrane protein YfcA
MLYPLLLVSVLSTAILSGILGMAGGMILMAILASTLPVASAMMLHGAVQLTSNGSRAWFLRRHIAWRIFPAYALGTALALGLFSALMLVPDAGVVLILVGALPILGRFTKRLQGLDITRPLTTVTCGFVVTAAQLLAGASGPLLDMFYLNSPLNRHAIVANKAITQAFGHAIKLLYYGLIIGAVDDVPLWFYGLAMATAVLGTRIGTRLLDRLEDASFRRWSGYVILAIATVCVVRGAYQLGM